MMLEQLWAIREEVRKKRPLVYNITNNVVTGFTANVLLAVGASPIMSEGEAEAEDLVRIADAVVLNIGTLHPRQTKYFLKAGKYAGKYNKPIILDPVGVGATTYRNETALELIDRLKITVIRGNYSEIKFLTGAAGKTKGVDSQDAEIDMEDMKALALKTGAIVCATGAADYITDGTRDYSNRTGHELLQTVVGTGCALSSLIGAFTSVSEDKVLGVLSALAFYGKAAEKAVALSRGPGSFAVSFIDALYSLEYEEFY
jgi:hydroxyethylthiazole kinase